MRSTISVAAAAALPFAVLAAPQDGGLGFSNFEKRGQIFFEACWPSTNEDDFRHIGCYKKHSTAKSILDIPIRWHDGKGPDIKEANMTVASCVAACKGVGARYAALQEGKLCDCGNELAGSITGDELCNKPCKGPTNASKWKHCGGNPEWSVYKDRSFKQKWDVDDAVRGYADGGCYVDDKVRIVRGSFTTDSGMTVDKCLRQCAEDGYPYAMTENGNQCFCGGGLREKAVPKPEKECNKKCSGEKDKGKTCGGFWRGRIYYNRHLDSSRPCSARPSGVAPANNPTPPPHKQSGPSKQPSRPEQDVEYETVTATITEERVVTKDSKNGKKGKYVITETITRVAPVTQRIDAKPTGKPGRNDDDDDEDDNNKDSGMKNQPPKNNSPAKVVITATVTKKVINTASKPANGDDDNNGDNDKENDKTKNSDSLPGGY
ncbi:hypothetical protein Dda_9007 [Drechslerella dactyloides]|uniref:WSC domain-containing protein n=1 Tax=Drechslerella dactyloides TaxID=74499 RepID=A0AAD6IPZ9_DREDA|nr:hypothetical protein Dda_9007 [Drechslerella dactyloides]